MKRAMLLGVLMLAACGVDGEPMQPAGGVNVSLSPSGVGLGANMGLTSGPLQVGLGL